MKHKRILRYAAVGATIALLAGCSSIGGGDGNADNAGDLAPEDMTMVTVVKLTGIGWFDRMEEGVNAFAAETGIDARQEGGDDASPEKQVAILQNLIAQSPTAITVVPNSAEALESVLADARAAGIIVVSHEAAGIENVDADIEAFDNTWYGEQILINLAECMGDEGEYVSFVGGLTANTHMTWVEGALAEQEANYPNLTRVETPIESKEDETVAYERAKEVIAKHPNIKGFQGSAGTDVAGIARAVQEAGLQDQICVMGTSIPSVASKYLDDGAIDKIFFWDPALAGEAQLKIAQLFAQGDAVEEGTDLGIEGYESLKKLDGFDNVFVGEAAVIVDKDNVDEYNF
ncbi:autoinducer 2 ABC transporter substrate-binding protein [Salinibacterium sp. M195]|uniref:autoinducer 2 ABC transporter substrate-binding protein n=1 Tax=Salinibacterium sp. M195 TaxID=2583374 RepID=UPI001C631049|nr:autoinducer 2 ABC transporter substrate-binding protein [Salinibacterium sp. M195]QYH35170.1 autoinducer 2 ABC transporter substrate-binding protein [Salinibacterium sp. M195]